jgi:hypothetical protein
MLILAGMLCLTTTSSLVQQVKIRGRSPQTQLGALVVSGGAGIQGNVNVGGNTIISGEVGEAVMRTWMAA